jgi:hypothetical protein
MVDIKFTPTQQRLLKVLSDGMPHKREELMACLADGLSNPVTVNNHLADIRKFLRLIGQDIICEFIHRQRQYRHVRLLNSVDDG